jgi:DNA-binding protein YbaB
MQPLTGREVMALSAGQAQDVAQQIDALNDQMRELQVRMAELAATDVTGTSPDGHVRATVTGMGRLREVTISPYGMRDLDNVALGASACAAIQAARLNAVAAMHDAVGGITPAPAEVPEQSEADIVAALRQALES